MSIVSSPSASGSCRAFAPTMTLPSSLLVKRAGVPGRCGPFISPNTSRNAMRVPAYGCGRRVGSVVKRRDDSSRRVHDCHV